jgi:hypothetical protein
LVLAKKKLNALVASSALKQMEEVLVFILSLRVTPLIKISLRTVSASWLNRVIRTALLMRTKYCLDKPRSIDSKVIMALAIDYRHRNFFAIEFL